MYRIICYLAALVCTGVMLLGATQAMSQTSVKSISGIGYIDYRNKPRFKVGDWTKYRYVADNDSSHIGDYDMTILIGGEERFWGDDGFWLETRSSGKTIDDDNGLLVSYSIFGDTLWFQRLQVYQRKSAEQNADKTIKQTLLHRTLTHAVSSVQAPVYTVLTDTLGWENVTTPAGTFRCRKVTRRWGIAATEEIGDSTRRMLNMDTRTVWLTDRIPMTSLAKEVARRTVTSRVWRIGKSDQAVESTVYDGGGTLTIASFGNKGPVQATLTPPYARRPLAEQLQAAGVTPSRPKRPRTTPHR